MFLSKEVIETQAPQAPDMSLEEVERLRELVASSDKKQQASSKAALKQQQADTQEQVLLAAKFQDRLNAIEYKHYGPVADSWGVIVKLVMELDRVRRPLMVSEVLGRTGFCTETAVRADELIITALQARLDACNDLKAEGVERLALLDEHLGAVRTVSESKVRDLDQRIILSRSAIGRAATQREENIQKLVALGLDLGLAQEKAKPTADEAKKQERELEYLIEQRNRHAAIVRSNVQQAAIAFEQT